MDERGVYGDIEKCKMRHYGKLGCEFLMIIQKRYVCMAICFLAIVVVTLCFLPIGKRVEVNEIDIDVRTNNSLEYFNKFDERSNERMLSKPYLEASREAVSILKNDKLVETRLLFSSYGKYGEGYVFGFLVLCKEIDFNKVVFVDNEGVAFFAISITLSEAAGYESLMSHYVHVINFYMMDRIAGFDENIFNPGEDVYVVLANDSFFISNKIKLYYYSEGDVVAQGDSVDSD